MEISDSVNPVWRNLVTNKIQVNLNFLPVKVLLAKWQLVLSRTDNLEEIDKAKREVFDLYFKNRNLPNAQKDIMLLLKKQ